MAFRYASVAAGQRSGPHGHGTRHHKARLGAQRQRWPSCPALSPVFSSSAKVKSQLPSPIWTPQTQFTSPTPTRPPAGTPGPGIDLRVPLSVRAVRWAAGLHWSFAHWAQHAGVCVGCLQPGSWAGNDGECCGAVRFGIDTVGR